LDAESRALAEFSASLDRALPSSTDPLAAALHPRLTVATGELSLVLAMSASLGSEIV